MTAGQEALFDLLASRRTIRRFRRDPVPRHVVERLIAAAVLAPSASNQQPWRFLATEDRTLLEALARRVEEKTALYGAHIPHVFRGQWEAYGDYFVRFRDAALVILCVWQPLAVLSNLLDGGLPEGERRGVEAMEVTSGLVSASLALENLLLAAHAMGLGASAMTGPLVAESDFRAAFGLPDRWRIAALVAVGYPAETPPPTPRRGPAQVLQWR